VTERSDTELLSGVDALVRLLALRHQLDQRDGLQTATMVSGYPGSPLGALDLAIEAAEPLLGPHRVVHRPGLNEELAVATVWGSQMGASVAYDGVDGVAGAWYGKGPGLDRAGDAIKHANAMGAGPSGGVVMFCADDPGAKSSTLTCDSQYTFEDACLPVLFPGNQQEVIDLGIHAFRMSRYSGAWVGMKIVTTVADGLGTVDLDPARHDPRDPDGVHIAGRPWRHRPQASIGPHQVPDQELLVVHHRLEAAKAYARHNRLDRVIGGPEPARLGIVCAGKTYYDLIQALADRGCRRSDLAAFGIRILTLAMTFPVDEQTVLDFAGSVEEILVVEEKRPFVEAQVRAVLHEAGRTVRVLGKRDRAGAPLVPITGELGADMIGEVLGRVVADLGTPHVSGQSAGGPLPLITIPGRPPAFCSGCPHNRSTVVPAGALVGGGVGCHGIVYFEARHRGETALPPTPMGAEGVPWIGLAPFVAEPHLIQNLGDGTLSHSGTLAIRASVAAGVNVTFKILYNAAVAMTGGQDVTGLMDVPSMTRALEAEGVARIVVCAEDPKHYPRRARWARGVRVVGRDQLPAVQDELRTVPGVSVVVYDQRCAAEARRLRKRGTLPTPPQRVVINEAVCEGCGDCSAKSNCLSVLPLATEFGEKRAIDDLSCNRDYTCIEGDCPSFVTITPKRSPSPRPAPSAAAGSRVAPPEGTLPDPRIPPIEGRFGIYFTGIGGTGVVTANRILAAAAESAGLVVDGLDQTGLSQKAGAVVSHLHLATSDDALGSAVVGRAGADLYLSGDILQAATPRHLDQVNPGHTRAVIGRGVTPTAMMLQTGAEPPTEGELDEQILARVGSDRTVFLDSGRIADLVFANHLLANVVLLGAAFQSGALPVPLAHIEAAIAAQGKAAEANRAAFDWGRWVVHANDRVEARLAEASAAQGGARDLFEPSTSALDVAGPLVTDAAVPADLRALLVRRTAQIVDYQNAKLARRYLDLLVTVSGQDDASHGWALTKATAESWFKLLTYKDEYEVARLHLRMDHDRVARGLGIDGPYAVTYHLHPPTLRRLGRSKKLPAGQPYELSFRVLRRMKRLRGTPFDPFGFDRDRRLERALIKEFEQLVTSSVAAATPATYDDLVTLAASALTIKGYGPIKERSVAAWRARVSELTNPAAPVVARMP